MRLGLPEPVLFGFTPRYRANWGENHPNNPMRETLTWSGVRISGLPLFSPRRFDPAPRRAELGHDTIPARDQVNR